MPGGFVAVKSAASRRLLTSTILLFAAAVMLCAAIRTSTPESPALGILYVVDSTGDGDLVGPVTICDDGTGHCTLRAAIEASNGHVGTDGISFNIPTAGNNCDASGNCTIVLPRNLPVLTDSVSIMGPGADKLTINGNGINVLAINGAGTVNVSNLRIENGNASNGGGINNLSGATLTVTNVTFSGNNSIDGNGPTDGGGAIKQWNGGTLNVVNSSFLSSTAAKVGGAIQAINGANVTVSGSTFSNNTSTLNGGAITQDGGTLSVSNSIFSNNAAGYGGAISATSGVTLMMTNVTFNSNNVCAPSCVNGANGGAIYQAGGPLTVTNSTFNSNTADLGGAIYQGGGTTTISGTSFSSNQASIGGAIENVGGGTLNITASVFVSNTAGLLPGGSSIGTGGAIATQTQTFIDSSTFSSNHAMQCQQCGGAQGGAIAMTALNSILAISGTTLYNNISDSDGGGLQVSEYVTATLTNVTLSGNTAGRNGGGIIQIKDPNNPAILNLNSVTISNNTADSVNNGSGHGGGIFQQADFLNKVGTINTRNSIIAGNFDTPNNAGGGTLNPDCSGTLTDQGYNLLGRNDGCGGLTNGVNGDQVGTSASPINPQLGPLQNNGGPTDTMELLSGSPAIDKGDDSVFGPPPFLSHDQRGYPRKIGAHVDIGAFEYEFGHRLRIISIAHSGSNIVVTFQAIQGVSYRLERKSAITDSTWNSISGVADLTAAGSGPAQITDTTGPISLGKAFYRVDLLP
jgi:predicted outer membrane repeat protein